MLRYRASKFDCDTRTLKMKCCPNTPARQVPRDINEYARDVTRRLMRTKAFLRSRDERKRVAKARSICIRTMSCLTKSGRRAFVENCSDILNRAIG
jgi:hypothetical protein